MKVSSRELIRSGRSGSVRRLDQFIAETSYLSLRTHMMRRAAETRADFRNRGLPTAGNEALDGDVILAAQAESVSGIVVTENPSHLGRMVAAVALDRM